VAALVTTSGSPTVVVAETSANDAAAAPTQLLSKLFGANVLNVKPPDITATKNAPTAKVLAIYLSSSPTRRRFETPAHATQSSRNGPASFNDSTSDSGDKGLAAEPHTKHGLMSPHELGCATMTLGSRSFERPRP
jgi:hypothetical protein